MARQERSAGFVVFHTNRDDGHQFLLLDYGRHWDFPKGHVEKGESDIQAAIRELKEETGISNARVVEGFQEEVVYFFRHPKHGLIRKTVIFFLAETLTLDVTLSHEHNAFEFLAYPVARSRLTFPSARKILDAAWKWLSPQVVARPGDNLSQSELVP
jgi:8-oxo-dGTP pyrophosphatase MutT (NUDIX family)